MVKRILFNIAFVVIVVLALDFAMGRILRYFYFHEVAGQSYCTTYAMEKTKADVLVFGSSTARHHYIPQVFEKFLNVSCYNAGRNKMCIFYHTAVLKSVLKRYKPKLIILEIPCFNKEPQAYDLLSTLLPYYKTHDEIRSILELRSPYEKIKLFSEIYPFNSLVYSIAAGNLEISKKRYPDYNGYVPLYNEWQGEIEPISSSNTFVLDSNKLSFFREFISTAKGSGAKVYVICSPIFQMNNLSQENEICNSICISEKIPFWDFSKDALFLQKKQFFQDNMHLNHRGAIAFSNAVAKKLKAEQN